MTKKSSTLRALWAWLGWVLVAGLGLQIFFVLRVASMAVFDPQSTAFERSEIWRISTSTSHLPWRQEWLAYDDISDNLKRAVIASEDDSFSNHDGVDWDALEKAWEKNARQKALADKRAEQAQKLAQRRVANGKNRAVVILPKPVKAPKIVGGSTITQQLAKNLLLSGERTFLRKGQEFVLTFMLEAFLSKRRILEIYLNNVEWGEGVFGAEAAARHYFRKSASKLSRDEAARLAVMLPRPKYFETRPGSSYISGRTSVIVARMADAELP